MATSCSTGGRLFSVIVPVWNAPELLRKCLTALAAQSLPRSQYEIIVADNGSTDNTGDIARSFEDVSVVRETKPGSYAARNAALDFARGRYIAFTDSDCVPGPEWLAEAKRALEANPEVAVVAGHIGLFEVARDAKPVFTNYERLYSFPQHLAPLGVCATANWVSPAALFREIGKFDEDVKSGSDHHMALRVLNAGRRLVYAPKMEVKHPVRSDWSALLNKRRRLSGGHWDRAKGRCRLCIVSWSTSIETARRLRTALFTKQLRPAEKASVALLVLRLYGVQMGEYLMLARGAAVTR